MRPGEQELPEKEIFTPQQESWFRYYNLTLMEKVERMSLQLRMPGMAKGVGWPRTQMELGQEDQLRRTKALRQFLDAQLIWSYPRKDQKMETKEIDFSKPVQMRGGEAIRILCVDAGGEYPVVGLTEEGLLSRWPLDGNSGNGPEHNFDLVNVPEAPSVRWLNIYKLKDGTLMPGTILWDVPPNGISNADMPVPQAEWFTIRKVEIFK